MTKLPIAVLISLSLTCLMGARSAQAQQTAQSRSGCVEGKADYPPEIAQIQNIEQFSVTFLGTEYDKKPEFIQAWMNKVVDANGDKKLDKSEIDKVICDITAVFERELPGVKPGSLIDENGNTDWMGFYASRPRISAMHLKFAMAAFGREWAKQQLSEGLDASAIRTLENFLRDGHWSVASKDAKAQVDLMGLDRTESGRLEKNLDLAYRVSEYKKQMGADWPYLKAKLIDSVKQMKSFPYVAYPGKGSVILAFNTVTPTTYGIDGSVRYYVLLGQQLTLSVTKAEVWGQPSDQMIFILTERKAYPSTDKFVANLRKKLQRLCKATNADDYRMMSSNHDTMNAVKFRMQSLSDKLSELFREDPVTIEVVNAKLDGGDRAHHVVYEEKLQFSWPEILDIRNSQAGENSDVNTYIVFLLVHEYIHFLQSTTDIYEMNERLYNSPQRADMMFGDVGYRNFYLAQPLENDAQKLAGEFVQMLDNRCELPVSL